MPESLVDTLRARVAGRVTAPDDAGWDVARGAYNLALDQRPDPEEPGTRFFRFVLNGVGLGIQLAPIGFTYYVLDLTGRLPYNVALIVGIALGTLFRFWSYRRWVWRAPLEQALEEEHEALQPEPAGAPAPERSDRARAD